MFNTLDDSLSFARIISTIIIMMIMIMKTMVKRISANLHNMYSAFITYGRTINALSVTIGYL